MFYISGEKMKYTLFVCSMLSITFVNAAERKHQVLTIENKHSHPVEITYQQYISQPSYVKSKDTTATAIIEPNLSQAIWILTPSNWSMKIPGFIASKKVHLSTESTITIHPIHKNQINVTQGQTLIETLRKKNDASSSDGEGCIQS